MGSKKPDQVVYNEEEGKYDASLKPYATNVGAPVIIPENISPWKNRGVRQVNDAISAEFEEIRAQYRRLEQRFRDNELVYSSKFSFQPQVGKTYHLYRNTKGENFLSILSPEECDFDHLGSFVLGSDYVWQRVSS